MVCYARGHQMNLIYKQCPVNQWPKYEDCVFTNWRDSLHKNYRAFLSQYGYTGIAADSVAVIMWHKLQVVAIWLLPPPEAM